MIGLGGGVCLLGEEGGGADSLSSLGNGGEGSEEMHASESWTQRSGLTAISSMGSTTTTFFLGLGG